MDITTQKLMMASASASNSGYFIQLFDGPYTFLRANVTSNQFSLIPGNTSSYFNLSLTTASLTIKLNEDYEIEWASSGPNFRIYDSSADSNGNSYLCGMNGSKGWFQKQSNQTTLPWTWTGGGGSGSQPTTGIHVDNNDEVIVITSSNQYSNYGCNIVKLNSSGNTLWGKLINQSPPTTSLGYGNAATDSNNNVYVSISQPTIGSNKYVPGIVKLEANTGNLVWEKYSNSNSSAARWRIAVSQNDEIYLGCTQNSNRADIMKCDASGNFKWTKSYTDTANFYFIDICTDSEDNVYIVCEVIGDDNNISTIILKVDSTGTLQWIRKLSLQTLEVNPTGIACDNNDDLIVTGSIKNSSGNNQGFLAKLAPDGSGIGTFSYVGGTFEYSSYSLQENPGGNNTNITSAITDLSLTGVSNAITDAVSATSIKIDM